MTDRQREEAALRRMIEDALEKHFQVSRALREGFAASIEDAARAIVACYRRGGRLLIMGNGGSASDAQHFATELVGRFLKERPALSAIALTADTSLLTALGNDYGYADVFRRQVEAHARPEDIVVGISTSGNSENVCRGLQAARAKGATTMILGGEDGGRMRALADLALLAPSRETPRIQEAHITIIHIVCALVEEAMSGDAPQ